jgi:hypothetical protein
MVRVKKTNSVLADHPLIGTWITEEEDSDVAFLVGVANNQFQVSGFCRSDGEKFEITQVEWDGEALSFVARMPSTDTTTKSIFRIRPDGMADLELTLYEIWKKKDVKPGNAPEAWQSS